MIGLSPTRGGTRLTGAGAIAQSAGSKTKRLPSQFRTKSEVKVLLGLQITCIA